MKINTKEQDFEKRVLEDGSYAARIYSIIDMGTQKGEYNGEPYERRELNFSFEIPSEMVEYKDKETGEDKKFPTTVYKTYNVSLHSKSALHKLVKVLEGEVPKVDGQFSYNTDDLIGKTVMVAVGKTSGGNDKIESVAPMPKGMTIEDAVNETKIFDLDNFDKDIFNSLPDWQKEKIKVTPEFEAL